MHDPSTWAKQASLAANGNWDALRKLQDELNGGKSIQINFALLQQQNKERKHHDFGAFVFIRLLIRFIVYPILISL